MRYLNICMCFLFIVFVKIACQVVIIQYLEANTYTAKAPKENTLFVHQLKLYPDTTLPKAKKANRVEKV